MNSEIDSIGNTASEELSKFSSNKYLEGSRYHSKGTNS